MFERNIIKQSKRFKKKTLVFLLELYCKKNMDDNQMIGHKTAGTKCFSYTLQRTQKLYEDDKTTYMTMQKMFENLFEMKQFANATQT